MVDETNPSYYTKMHCEGRKKLFQLYCALKRDSAAIKHKFLKYKSLN